MRLVEVITAQSEQPALADESLSYQYPPHFPLSAEQRQATLAMRADTDAVYVAMVPELAGPIIEARAEELGLTPKQVTEALEAAQARLEGDPTPPPMGGDA